MAVSLVVEGLAVSRGVSPPRRISAMSRRLGPGVDRFLPPGMCASLAGFGGEVLELPGVVPQAFAAARMWMVRSSRSGGSTATKGTRNAIKPETE